MSDHITPKAAEEIIAGIDLYDKRQMWGTFPDRYDPYYVYELADLVANMHYEYAVELKHGDWWNTSRHRASTIEAAKEIAARYTRTETRIVRRLVSAPEVVE